MTSFDENGKYIKTNWKAGDKITSTKLNKIEESIEAVNDNDISRHVEADTRLDALEAKDVAHDKELTKIKNTIADNKAAAELGDYEINSRMTFLEEELNEGIEEVHNVAETVDGKIDKAESDMTNAVNTAKDEMAAQVNTAQANMAAQVNKGKADMEAMVAEVDGKIAEAETNMTNATNEMTAQVNTATANMTTQVNNAKSEMATQVTTAKNEMTAQVNSAKSEVTSQLDSAMDSVNTTHATMLSMVDYVDTEIFTFENQVNKAKSDIEDQVDQAKSDLEGMKNYGAENVGKILVVGSDGRVILMNMPDVSTSGDMVAVVDKSNNIILSGDLADGTYVLKYENADGTYSDIGTLVIGTIEPGPEPFEGNLFNLETTKLNTRFSSSGTEKEQNGVWLSDFIPFDINEHHTLYVKNAIMKRDVSAQPGPSVVFFDENKAYLSILYCSPALANYNDWAYKISDDYYKVVFNVKDIISNSYWKNVKYIKVSGVESEAGNFMVKNDIKDVIITLNTPIEDEGTQEPTPDTPDSPVIIEGNLFNLDTVQLNKKISGSSGSISTQNGAWLTDLIPINITEISALYVKNAMMRQDNGVAAPSPLLTFHGSDGAFLGCLRCNGAHASYQQYVEIISENYTKIDFTHTILTTSSWYSKVKYMRVNGVENPNGTAISSQNDIADVIIKINEPIE